MGNKVRILFVRFSSIGDIVLTTPIVRCVKEQLEGDVQVHYLTKNSYRNLLEENPYVDKVHSIDKSVSEVIEELQSQEFDYVVDLHKNIRSSQVKSKLKGLSFTFNKLNIEKWVLVNFGVNWLPDIHIVDRYFEAVKAFGINNDHKGLDYFIPEKDHVALTTLPEKFQNGFISFAIGGKFAGKKMPLDKITKICNEISYPIVLLGGKEDQAEGDQIIANNRDVYNACGLYNLNQSASLVKQSVLVITHDTGLMHIAAAFKKDIVSIWGATVPEFGMSPYLPGPHSKMIQASHLKYRPTSKLGNKDTAKERRTMEEIDEKEVLEAVAEILAISTPLD